MFAFYLPLSPTPPVSSSRPEPIMEEAISSEVDHRRPVAKVTSPAESEDSVQRKREAFINLAREMDEFLEAREQRRGGTARAREA